MDPFPIRLRREVGRRIRFNRKKKRLTQGEIAKALGLTRTAVSNIETGRQFIYLHTLYIVAKSLGVNLDHLIPPLSFLDSDRLEVRLSSEPIDAESRKRIFAVLNPILKKSKVVR